MDMTTSEDGRERPWLESYPDGIAWDVSIDQTPVHELVLASCDKQGDKTALDFLGATMSFAELGDNIRAFAGALQSELGVKKGTRVAFMMPNTPFYPIAYYAVLLAGGTVVNCNPLYTVKELSHITGNAGARIVITVDLRQTFEKAEALVRNDCADTLVVAQFASALPKVKKLLFSIARKGDIADVGQSDVSASIHRFADLIDKNIAPTPVAIDPLQDIAVQQYTGGTTGLPKGAQLTHANVTANTSQIDAWGLGLFYPPTKVVAVLPFFHIFAMTVCLNIPLSAGAMVAMLPRFELKALLDLLVRTKANVMPAVPTLLHALASSRKARPEHLQHLEVAVSGGAPLPNETRRLFAQKSKALLAEGYGLTECSPVVTCAALRVPSKPMSIGQPIPGTDVRFVDLNDPTKFVPMGERGELVTRGPQVMKGYYKDEAANAEAFVNGWFRTGDVGYIDEDGYIFLVDRIKDLILCSGFNVYPRTIEEALLQHEAVDECTVIGVKDEYRGEAPVAFVKPTEGMSISASELKDYLAEHLSKIQMPREIIFKNELPKTLIGKPSKKELRAEYASSREAPRE